MKPFWIFRPLGLLVLLLAFAAIVAGCASGSSSSGSSHPAIDDDSSADDDDNDNDDAVDDDSADDDDDNDDDSADDDDDNDDDDNDDDNDNDDNDDDVADPWAVEFDGSSGYGATSGGLNPNVGATFTVEGWLYFANIDYTSTTVSVIDNTTFSKGTTSNGFWIQMNGAGGLTFDYIYAAGQANAIGVPFASVTLETWHHVAATYDYNVPQICFFLDGAAEGCMSVVGQPYVVSDSYVILGRWAGGSAEYFEGRMDMVRISDVVRYTGSFTPATYFAVDGNTVALWRIDEGSGYELYDAAGNGNNELTSAGVTWVAR